MNATQLNNKTFRLIYPSALLLLALTTSGCAPRNNSNLERVQRDLIVIKNDSRVAMQAPTELQEADQAVSRVENSWEATHDSQEAEHLSYLAEKRIEIAKVKTNQLLAENEAVRLSKARDTASVNAQTLSLREAEARASLANANTIRTVALIEDRRSEIEELKAELKELKANQSTRGLTLTLEDVVFETNKAEFKSGAARKLTPLITYVRNHPLENVAIEGHTDNTGTVASNLDLSSRRAEAVRQLLIDGGIHSDRIITRGLGEQFPVASNDSAAGRLQNRRVEIIVSAQASGFQVNNR